MISRKTSADEAKRSVAVSAAAMAAADRINADVNVNFFIALLLYALSRDARSAVLHLGRHGTRTHWSFSDTRHGAVQNNRTRRPPWSGTSESARAGGAGNCSDRPFRV